MCESLCVLTWTHPHPGTGDTIDAFEECLAQAPSTTCSQAHHATMARDGTTVMHVSSVLTAVDAVVYTGNVAFYNGRDSAEQVVWAGEAFGYHIVEDATVVSSSCALLAATPSAGARESGQNSLVRVFHRGSDGVWVSDGAPPTAAVDYVGTPAQVCVCVCVCVM